MFATGPSAADSEVLARAITQVLTLLFKNFGPWGTAFLIIMLTLAAMFWHYLAEQGKLKQFQVALDEKERTIQRLAANERMWRMVFLNKFGKYSEEAAILMTLEGGSNPSETREKLKRQVASMKEVEKKDDA